MSHYSPVHNRDWSRRNRSRAWEIVGGKLLLEASSDLLKSRAIPFCPAAVRASFTVLCESFTEPFLIGVSVDTISTSLAASAPAPWQVVSCKKMLTKVGFVVRSMWPFCKLNIMILELSVVILIFQFQHGVQWNWLKCWRCRSWQRARRWRRWIVWHQFWKRQIWYWSLRGALTKLSVTWMPAHLDKVKQEGPAMSDVFGFPGLVVSCGERGGQLEMGIPVNAFFVEETLAATFVVQIMCKQSEVANALRVAVVLSFGPVLMLWYSLRMNMLNAELVVAAIHRAQGLSLVHVQVSGQVV